MSNVRKSHKLEVRVKVEQNISKKVHKFKIFKIFGEYAVFNSLMFCS